MARKYMNGPRRIKKEEELDDYDEDKYVEYDEENYEDWDDYDEENYFNEDDPYNLM